MLTGKMNINTSNRSEGIVVRSLTKILFYFAL